MPIRGADFAAAAYGAACRGDGRDARPGSAGPRTCCYLPDGAGPVPAIVVYFPYLKDGPHGRGAIYDWQAHFARRGYACLTVDFRGTGASEGRVAPPFSASEREDALDLH